MILSAKNKASAIDPVCGMVVAPGANKIIASFDGETYYFCAEGCRLSFKKNPKKFLKSKPGKKKGIWGRYLDSLEKANGGRPMKCH
jgi:Cu+-exporting ATPase